LGAVLLLSILQIAIHRFNNPMDQPKPEIVGNACLIWGTGENRHYPGAGITDAQTLCVWQQ
jgi:hypothetical protein